MTLEEWQKLSEFLKKNHEFVYDKKEEIFLPSGLLKVGCKWGRSEVVSFGFYFWDVEDRYKGFLSILDLAIESGIKTEGIYVSLKNGSPNGCFYDDMHFEGRMKLPEKIDDFEHAHVIIPTGTLCYYAKCHDGIRTHINCDWKISLDVFLTFYHELRNLYKMQQEQ
jgi:hypothetical protein